MRPRGGGRAETPGSRTSPRRAASTRGQTRTADAGHRRGAHDTVALGGGERYSGARARERGLQTAGAGGVAAEGGGHRRRGCSGRLGGGRGRQGPDAPVKGGGMGRPGVPPGPRCLGRRAGGGAGDKCGGAAGHAATRGRRRRNSRGANRAQRGRRGRKGGDPRLDGQRAVCGSRKAGRAARRGERAAHR